MEGCATLLVKLCLKTVPYLLQEKRSFTTDKVQGETSNKEITTNYHYLTQNVY
jgi:hypothetical protein